jgi:5'-3' exonuclease
MKHLLIDGKNNAYRSVFAGFSDQRFLSSGHDYFVIFLRFLSSYINKFRPESVHVFWDTPTKSVWRKQLYKDYKENRIQSMSMYEIDVPATLKRQVVLGCNILNNLNVRQYYRDTQEADDLIYAFVCANKQDDNIIISADGDFKQIIYKNNSVKIYNPLSKNKNTDFEEIPKHDPVIVKSLMGDKSDNISGYYMVGAERSKKISADSNSLSEFLKSEKAVILLEDGSKKIVGDEIFNLNRKIIDLSLNPSLYDNINYVKEKCVSTVIYNTKSIGQIAIKYKVRGLLGDLTNLTSNFKHLI